MVLILNLNFNEMKESSILFDEKSYVYLSKIIKNYKIKEKYTSKKYENTNKKV